jgi:hypothetical protein
MEFIRGLKTNRPCMDCGVVYPYYVLEFDHVRGMKKFPISNVSGGELSLRALRIEVAKCDLVCANCHRERTFSRIRNEEKKEQGEAPPLVNLWLQ